jgi:hypothetical protein
MILFLLLAMAGFGTDLGWIYLNSVRTQNAADAAALAGVVNLPGFDPAPDAAAAARANGYDPGGADTLTVTPLPDNTLHAELSTSIEPFFMRVLGFTRFDITREATARYIQPVPLGNPSNCFGCPEVGSSWAAVSSPYVGKQQGDPYSTRCLVSSGVSSCSSANPDYERGGSYAGYYYGISVDPGASNLTVDLYDAAHNTRPPQTETGDLDYGSGSGVTTHFQLFAPDDSPHDPTDNPAVTGCSLDLAPNTGTNMNSWDNLCTVGSLTEGIYLLQVWSSGDGVASNHYSVRANASGATPRVFGLNDMSIYSNNLTANTELYLAEIEAVHAGKVLELSFFDAGDAGAPSTMTVLDPFGDPVQCSWEVWNHSMTNLLSAASGGCDWDTSNQSYNNQWIVARIDLADEESDMCDGSNCFWKVRFNLSDPTDRTTWRARVIGNPVQLIPTPTTTTP